MFLVTQVMFVSSGATECFHGLELPTQGEGFGVNWRAILWEGRCSAPTPRAGDRAGSLLTHVLPWGGRERCETPALAPRSRHRSQKHSLWKSPQENHGLRRQEEPLSIPLRSPSLAELPEEA